MSETMETINVNMTDGEDGQEKAANMGNTAPYLAFVFDGLHFAVDTENVIEIINNHMIRPLPMVPDYVRGLINLRGQAIPVIDMRLRAGKPFQEYTPKTCIIILEIEANIIGIVVDSVSQVIDIQKDHITPIPTEKRQELTKYMVSDEDGTVILLLECEAIINDHM